MANQNDSQKKDQKSTQKPGTKSNPQTGAQKKGSQSPKK